MSSFNFVLLLFLINSACAIPVSKKPREFDIFLSIYEIPNDASQKLTIESPEAYYAKLFEKSVQLHNFGDKLLSSKSSQLLSVWNQLKSLSYKNQMPVKDFILQTTQLYNSLSRMDQKRLNKTFLRLYGYKFSEYFVYNNYSKNTADEFLGDSIDRITIEAFD